MNGVSPTMNGTSCILSRPGESGGGSSLVISNVLNTPKEKFPYTIPVTSNHLPHSSVGGGELSVSSATVETIITMSPTVEKQTPMQEVLC